MADRKVSDKQLIEALLRERDELYRRAVKAERLCGQLSDAKAMRLSYEARIRQMEADHQKQVSDMEADHQKQVGDMEAGYQKRVSDMEAGYQKRVGDMEAGYQKLLSKKEDEIRDLVRKLEYMSRKLWGKMSEKRQTPEDPNQLKLDFGFEDLTEEEKRLAGEAARAVTEARRTVKVKEHVKQVPVRHKLPENLRRVEEHVYPEGYLGNEQDWVLFEAVETSEHLEVPAPDMWVRVTVRHKAMRKADNAIVTAPVPTEPLAKSYASALNEAGAILPKSPIGKAVHYLLNHIRQLSRYVTDGRYKIDNNDIENSVRPLAVGRKGYLFCGNHDAAEDAAVIYTFMGCCKLAGVDVRKWMDYFLKHIHDYDTDYSRNLSELFPHNLKKAGII